jgi:heptosyltransferase-2
MDPNENFDILYNFDIDNEATILAKSINALEKYGFKSEEGFPATFNMGAEYYLNILFDDELKKNNKKTYQQMMFDAAGLEWGKQNCPIFLNEKDKTYADNFIQKNDLNDKNVIGIHVGAGSRWPSKVWHKEELEKFIILAKKNGFEIILFGGPNEKERHRELAQELKNKNINIFLNNPNNTSKQFASLIDKCSLIVCADSFALHVSLALKKNTIALFFCSSPWEIEDYGLLKKLISPMILDFFPEKMNEYSEDLTRSIKAEQVMSEVQRITGKR